MPRWTIAAGTGVVAALFLLPHLLTPHLLPRGTAYDPLPVVGADLATFEESMNAAGALHEVVEGRWLVRDPSLGEHKDGPVFAGPLTWLVGGLAAKAVGIPGLFVLGDALLPALTFLLAALLVRRWTGSTALAVLAAVGVTLGHAFVQQFPPVAEGIRSYAQLFRISGAEQVPLDLARFPFPQLSLPAFLGAWLAVDGALAKPTHGRVLLAGALAGIQLSLYFYNGVVTLAALASLATLRRIARDPTGAYAAARVFGYALLLAVPSLLASAELRQLPDAAGVLRRVGLEVGRVPELARSLVVSAVAIAVALAAGWRSRRAAAVLAVLLGGLAAMNAQLITGFSLQRWHFFARILNPWFPVALAVAAAALAERWPQRSRRGSVVVATVLALGAIGWAAAYQVVFARSTAAVHIMSPADAALVSWLNANAPRDAVVGTPSFATVALLPSRTSLNTYVPFGGMTLASNEELTDRYLRLAKLLSLGEGFVRDTFAFHPERSAAEKAACTGERCALDWSLKDRNATEQLLHFTYLRLRTGLTTFEHEIRMPEVEVERLVQRFRALPDDPAALPGPYRLDYVVIGKRERALGARPLPPAAVARTVEVGGWTVQEVTR